MHRLRRLLAAAPARRLAAVLAGVLLLVQFAAAGHLHRPGHDLDRRAAHSVCEICVAADRVGVAPPSIRLLPPPRSAARYAPPTALAAPRTPAPAGYSSRAPPFALA